MGAAAYLLKRGRSVRALSGFGKDPVDAEGWSFLTRDSFRLMLGECRDEKPASELGDHSYFAYWYVDDVDQYYEEILARGGLMTSAPSDKPWGIREFSMHTRPPHHVWPTGASLTCRRTLVECPYTNHGSNGEAI